MTNSNMGTNLNSNNKGVVNNMSKTNSTNNGANLNNKGVKDMNKVLNHGDIIVIGGRKVKFIMPVENSKVLVKVLSGVKTIIVDITTGKEYSIAESIRFVREENSNKLLSNSYEHRVLTSVFSADRMIDMYSFQLRGNGESASIVSEVGSLTIKGETLSLALISGDYVALRGCIKDIVNSNKMEVIGSKKYVSPLKVEKLNLDGAPINKVTVSKAMLEDVKKAINMADLYDPSNLIKISLDLDVVIRLYQETVIDAAKTGEFIKLDLLVNNYRDKSHLAFKSEIKRNDEGHNVVSITREDGSEKKTYNDSVYSEIQDEVIKEVEATVQSLIDVSIESDTKMEETVSYLLKKNSTDMMKFAKNISYFYKSIVGSIAEEKQDLDPEEDKPTFDLLKEMQKHGFNLLSQYARTTLAYNNWTDSFKSIALFSAVDSVVRRDGVEVRIPLNEVTAKTAMNVLPEEYQIYTNNNNNIIKPGYFIRNAVVRGTTIYNDGDVAYFENNQDVQTGHLLSTKESFTGLAEIKVVCDEEDNTKVTAVKAIVPTVIEIPNYDENEVIFMLRAEGKPEIKKGDYAKINKFATNRITASGKQQFIAPRVSINDKRFDVICDTKVEGYLNELEGNIIDIFTVKYTTNDGKEMYKAMIKVAKKVTKEIVNNLTTVDNNGNVVTEPTFSTVDVVDGIDAQFDYDALINETIDLSDLSNTGSDLTPKSIEDIDNEMISLLDDLEDEDFEDFE